MIYSVKCVTLLPTTAGPSFRRTVNDEETFFLLAEAGKGWLYATAYLHLPSISSVIVSAYVQIQLTTALDNLKVKDHNACNHYYHYVQREKLYFIIGVKHF